MGWLETGKAVFPYSLQFGAVFTPGTTKGLGDSGMINKQICNTRAANTCNAGSC